MMFLSLLIWLWVIGIHAVSGIILMPAIRPLHSPRTAPGPIFLKYSDTGAGKVRVRSRVTLLNLLIKNMNGICFHCSCRKLVKVIIRQHCNSCPTHNRVWGTNNKMWAIPQTMFNAFIYDYLDKPELAHTDYKLPWKF